MNHLALSGLLIFLTSLLSASFVLAKGPKRDVSLTWGLFSLSVALWGFGLFMGFITDVESSALFWGRFLNLSALFIPLFFFHFVLCFTNKINDKIKELFFYYFIFLACFFTAIILPNTFIPFVKPAVSFKFYPKPGFLYYGFSLIFAYLVIYGIILLFKDLNSSFGVRKNQIKYLLFGVFVGFAGGSNTFFPVFNLKIYPLGTYLVPVYVLTVAYAIVRHQLMDIEVIIKRSLVFAGTFIFAFGVFVAVTLTVSQLIGGGRILSLAISSLIIVIGLRPIETWLIDATDKFLFQKKYEYKEIIRVFIGEVITKLNLDDVINSTLKILDETIHPYASGIFILNKVDDKYQLYNTIGLEDKNTSFTSESKLVIYLKRSGNPAIVKQIDGITSANPEVASEMVTLKATLVLPLMLHDDLIGFISLGGKKSDESYSKDDLEVLQDLARTESVAVGNSQLLAEAAQSERRAAIGTMAAGINHEIGNPLNTINTKIQVFRTAVERGFYKDKPKEEIMEECVAILNETIKQTERIADITKKLSNFAKPGKEFKPELISVPREIDNSLAIVGHDLGSERIKIVKEISSQPNEILADKGETQQIFFNIIRNAGQAIDGPGAITIRVFTTPDGKVRVEIEDTGQGVSQDKMHRVFEPFFTTKGLNKGTGLGLSIVRQLVWKNKGEISFKSQVGVGTTFILEFPKGEQV